MYIEIILATTCILFGAMSVLSKGFGKIVINLFLMSLTLAAVFAYLGAPVLAIVQVLLSIFTLLCYFVFSLKMVNQSHSDNKGCHMSCKFIGITSILALVGGLGFYLISNPDLFERSSDLIDMSKLSIITNEYWPMILILTVLANLILIGSFFITDSEEA